MTQPDTNEAPPLSPAATTAPRGRSGKPAAEGAALGAILLAALALRLWGLAQNGWGAEYYSAAVRSMAMSLSNFFFCAFDPAGFISVDKPPLALWLQVLGVKLLGFRPLGLLLPQVLEGVAAVAVLYGLVRRTFGVLPALLAALFLAVTPIWVAVNRTNNMDTCLVLFLLLAAWALLKATEGGRRGLLLLAMALLGLAFNVKMLAAFIVLPTFVLVYALGAPGTWPRRLADLVLAGLVLLATSLPWVLAVDLTPAGQRPFVGSSRTNSMLELVVGHNAASRFFSRAAPPLPALDDHQALALAEAPNGPAATTRDRLRLLAKRLYVSVPAGPARLLEGRMAAQVGWLLPLALAGLMLGGLPRPWRRPLSPAGLALLFWLGWTLTYVVVYSSLGGIIHYYYLATLAPALAALAGVGLAGLWERRGRGRPWGAALAAALALTALWQLRLQAGGLGWGLVELLAPPQAWLAWLQGALVLGCLAAAGLALARGGPARACLSLGLAALLVLPLTWCLSSVLWPGHGIMPSADLHRLLGPPSDASLLARQRQGQEAALAELAGFLQANRRQERFLLATSTSRLAAPLIIQTGLPVMARGGFHGLDPAVGPQDMERLVGEGRLRFALLGDLVASNRKLGGEEAGRETAAWIRSRGRAVEPSLWRAGRFGPGLELYDLRPEAPLLAARRDGQAD